MALLAEAKRILDATYDALKAGDGVSAKVTTLIYELERMRTSSDTAEWTEIKQLARSHELQARLLEDPYTCRALTKPRGYAGDAVMMDYIYFMDAPAGTTGKGAEIFHATAGSSNGASVRERAVRLASRIDSVLAQSASASVLSVACGHLRELSKTQAFATGMQLDGFYAADQDRESLALVEREYRSRGVRTLPISVAGILRNKLPNLRFDLIYSAGLYDYLNKEVAERLTRKLAGYLAPKGELLIANFLPNHDGRAYMETYMDWDLICRTDEDMVGLAEAARLEGKHHVSVEHDTPGNVVYLSIRLA